MEPMNIKKYARYLLEVMKANDVNCVSATFEGCGDSGEITGVSLYSLNDKSPVSDFTEKAKTTEIKATVIKFTSSHFNSEIMSFKEELISLYDFFEQYVEYLSHRDAIDWWNNGGGKGEMYINISDDTFNFSIETYETETPVYNEGSIQDWIDENENAETD